MDNDRLDQLLQHAASKQFWLKPVGLGDRPIIIDGREKETFPEAEVEIRFTRKADEVRDGDVLIVYRVGVASVMYIAERLPQQQWTTSEHQYQDGVRERYPEWFKARNLTPTFGDHWQRFEIKPFTLAKLLNPEHPTDGARLGRLNYGSDRALIPRWFAEEIIQRVRAAD